MLADDMDTYCSNISLLLKFFAYLNAILLSMCDRKLSSAFRHSCDFDGQYKRHLHFNRRLVTAAGPLIEFTRPAILQRHV